MFLEVVTVLSSLSITCFELQDAWNQSQNQNENEDIDRAIALSLVEETQKANNHVNGV